MFCSEWECFFFVGSRKLVLVGLQQEKCLLSWELSPVLSFLLIFWFVLWGIYKWHRVSHWGGFYFCLLFSNLTAQPVLRLIGFYSQVNFYIESISIIHKQRFPVEIMFEKIFKLTVRYSLQKYKETLIRLVHFVVGWGEGVGKKCVSN